MTSPMQHPSESQSSRSRNAQAQAELRARRKAHISNLESSNAQLKCKNDELQAERHMMLDQIEILKGQVKTLRRSLGERREAKSSGDVAVDTLLKAVETERRKVKKLRNAIRKVAEMNALESDSDSEEVSRIASTSYKRKRSLAVTSPKEPNWNLPSTSTSLGLERQSILSYETSSTATTLSVDSPITPMATSIDENEMIPKARIFQSGPAEDDPSQSALTLLLAQPARFKQQVIQALAKDAQQQISPTINHQEDILARFFDTLSTPAQELPSRTYNRSTFEHLHSASVFLVFLLIILGRNVKEKKGDGLIWW